MRRCGIQKREEATQAVRTTPPRVRRDTVVVFSSNALVFGERRVHPDDLAWLLSFGAPLESRPSGRALDLVRAGLDEVRKIGIT
jgi:hypothetical protein